LGYKSSYGWDFGKKEVSGREQTKREIQKHIQELRSTKISVGTIDGDWKTKQQEDFNDKSLLRDGVTMMDMATRKSNLRMGIDKNNW